MNSMNVRSKVFFRLGLACALAGVAVLGNASCNDEDQDKCSQKWVPVRCENGQLFQSDGCGNESPFPCKCGCAPSAKKCIQEIDTLKNPLPAQCHDITNCAVLSFVPSKCEEDSDNNSGAKYSLLYSKECDQSTLKAGGPCLARTTWADESVTFQKMDIHPSSQTTKIFGCEELQPKSVELVCISRFDDVEACLDPFEAFEEICPAPL